MTKNKTTELFEFAEDHADVDFLVGMLKGQGWMLAQEISTRILDKTGVLWSDRRIRALASASRGRIIPGQRGYKLTLEASPEEINAVAWLKNQGEEMTQRYIDILKVWHKRKEACNS